MARVDLKFEEFLRLVKVARHGCARPDDMHDSSFAHVVAGEGRIRLRVIDQVAELSVTGEAETEGEIDTLLPMRHLSALVRSGRDISIALTDTGAKARSGRMSFNLPVLGSVRMSSIVIQQEIARFTVALPAMIDHVLPAAATDGDVYRGLDGVALHAVGKRLRVVATNRVSLRALSIPMESETTWLVTVPRVTARNIAKLFEGEVEAILCEHGIEVSGGGIQIRSRLLSPGMPEGYHQVLVGQSEVRGTLRAAEFLDALEAVVPFVSQAQRRTRYALCRVREGELLVAAADDRGIAALAPVPIEMTGEVPDFSLKAEEIIPLLRDLRTEEATIHFHIKSGQCQVLWIEEPGHSDSRMIIAPAIGTWPAEGIQQQAA